jgi:hypothetical protein
LLFDIVTECPLALETVFLHVFVGEFAITRLMNIPRQYHRLSSLEGIYMSQLQVIGEECQGASHCECALCGIAKGSWDMVWQDSLVDFPWILGLCKL